MFRNAGILLAPVLLGLSFYSVPRNPETVVLEAESFAEIREPMKVVRHDELVSAGAYIDLASGAGQGWRGLGEGAVTYRVEVTRPGAYSIWGRCRWLDGCTNAFFLEANGGSRVVFGNDPVYAQWHWVKSPPVSLEIGVNSLTFSNHSDGTALDKLIVTDDPNYYPEGLGKGITRFYEGFAGCDADNTGSWQFLSGKWRVIHSVGESAGGANEVLAQWDPKGGTAIGGFPVWSGYSARVSFMFGSQGRIGMIFFRKTAGEEWRLEMRMEGEKGKIRLIQETGGQEEVIRSQYLESCKPDQWYDLGYDLRGERIVAFLDEKALFSAEAPSSRLGQIGLFAVDPIASYFDNVEVRFLDEKQIEPPKIASGDVIPVSEFR